MIYYDPLLGRLVSSQDNVVQTLVLTVGNPLTTEYIIGRIPVGATITEICYIATGSDISNIPNQLNTYIQSLVYNPGGVIDDTNHQYKVKTQDSYFVNNLILDTFDYDNVVAGDLLILHLTDLVQSDQIFVSIAYITK